MSAFVRGAAGVVTLVVVWFVLAWQLGSAQGSIERLADPVDVARALASYLAGGIWPDVWSSLQVFFGGWLIGGACAAFLGLLIGRVRIVGQTLLPIVETIRPVSSIVWVPLSVVWFGFGYASKAFVVGLSVFLVVIVYAIDGCSRIPPDVERTATMLGFGRWRRIKEMIVPATLDEVMIGLRVALAAGWGTVIVAELVAADTGLGAQLIDEQQSYDITGVMATMVCFAVTGFLLNSAFSFVQNRLMPWRVRDV